MVYEYGSFHCVCMKLEYKIIGHLYEVSSYRPLKGEIKNMIPNSSFLRHFYPSA